MTTPPRLVPMRVQQPVIIGGRLLQPGATVAMPLEVALMLWHRRQALPVHAADLGALYAELAPTR